MSPLRDIETEQSSETSLDYSESSNIGSSKKKMVVFDKVKVVEFLPALGDNPSVSAGVPVALSKEHVQIREVDLDQYERQRKPRRDLFDLLLERGVREKM
jgi:hypothetical protein